jgi:hypothetical protein
MDDRVSALEREGQAKRGRSTAWALRRVFASIGERTRLAFRRTWRTYLVSRAEMFRSPHSNPHLFQVTFSKGNVDASNYPMTRRHLYSA